MIKSYSANFNPIVNKTYQMKFAAILWNFMNTILYMHANNLTIIYAANNSQLALYLLANCMHEYNQSFPQKD